MDNAQELASKIGFEQLAGHQNTGSPTVAYIIADDSYSSLAEFSGLLSGTGALVEYFDHNASILDIAERLRGQCPEKGFEALHLISHGRQAQLSIGGDLLTGKNIHKYDSQLKEIGSLMAVDGDILIYGCEIGRGSDGKQLIESIAKITGADVAASDDITGMAVKDEAKDWDLEIKEGDINSSINAVLQGLEWRGSLALPLIGIVAKVLGEAVVGAFAGYAVEQLVTTEDKKTKEKNIVLQFPGTSAETTPAPEKTGIDPTQFVKSALFLDTNGDLVDVRLSGSGEFKLSLSGGLTNLADASSLELRNTDENTNLSVSVSPIGQAINAGSATSVNSQTQEIAISGLYNRMYSPGYTNIDRIFSSNQKGKIGDIELTAAIVNNIDLTGFDINAIELDTGYTTLVDRVNTTTLSSSSGLSNTISGNVVSGNKSLDGEIIDFAIIDDNPIFNGFGAGGSVYQPVTGLIDLRNISANSIERLIINGSIGAQTGNPNDPSTTNDIKGTVNVSGRIGTISAIRSRLDGQIQAGSIEKIDIGRIDGSITTTDSTKSLSITLPSTYSGVINSAGHLNLAYTFYSSVGDPDIDLTPGPTVGRIISGGGISGIYASEADAIYVPSGYNAVVRNASSEKGITDIRVNGALSSSWYSATDIGNISANTITDSAVIEADRDIGSIKALRRVTVPLEVVDPQVTTAPEINLGGTFIAGRSIGNISSATGISAIIRAESGSIGTISALSGGIDSKLIEAGQNIGQITVQSQSLVGPKIVAQQGSIEGIKVYTGTLDGVIRAGSGEVDDAKKPTHNIGHIYVEKGSLHQLSVAATGSIGDITVKGSNTIEGGTFSAGVKIGNVTASSSRGTAIKGALFEAGDANGQYRDADGLIKTSQIGSIKAQSSGATIVPSVDVGMPNKLGSLPAQPVETAAHGIEATQIIAGKIGTVSGIASTGSGIVGVPFKVPRDPDVEIKPDDLSEGYTVIHAKVGNIDEIYGVGNGHGLANVVAVAEQSIGNIKGYSNVKGTGIEAGIFNANMGDIGDVVGSGGVGGGNGLNDTFLKALGKISKISGQTNANEGDGIRQIDARAGVYGLIEASVLGGKGGDALTPRGSGIVLSSFKGYNDTSVKLVGNADAPDIKLENRFYKQDGIEAIKVEVKSVYGRGIDRSEFDVKSSIGLINSRSFGNSAIFESEFSVSRGQSQYSQNEAIEVGDIRQIVAEAQNSGNSIDTSIFTAENGSIGNGTLGITVKSGGLAATDHGINGSSFDADKNIGVINASSKGGVAINGSSFAADSNFDNIGEIQSISATSYGENSKASAAIKGSEFTGAAISKVYASVEDFDGGDGIEGSEFEARTAIYDELTGAINNKGSIGLIVVNNASRIGDGIANSKFTAGAAGSIGNIMVDVISKKLDQANAYNRAASGRAIHLSEFRASALDPDQTSLTGTIGDITIKAGRVIPENVPDVLLPTNAAPPNDQSTLEGAGINASYFSAYGGIGNINVESIGTGVFGSVFLGNSDPLNGIAGFIANTVAQDRGEGDIKGIKIESKGLYGTGSLMNLFAGGGIGDVSITGKGFPIPDPTAVIRQLQNLGNLATALQSGQILPVVKAGGMQILDFLTTPIKLSSSPVTLSAFVALRKDIGSIRFINSSEFGNYPFLGSLIYAKGSYGAVTTNPVAIKAGADRLIENSLAASGFTSPNVFTFYPLPTTFIGTKRTGGNLPNPR